MNRDTTPEEYMAQAEACLNTAKEELAKAKAAQAEARVLIALIEAALDERTDRKTAAQVVRAVNHIQSDNN